VSPATNIAIVAVIAVLVLGFLVWATLRQRRSGDLRARFGPEYDRLVRARGNPAAERELDWRTEHVRHLSIRPLRPDERERYAQAWRKRQGRFVDDPAGAVLDADGLVEEVMRVRGYPVGDFERQVADVSVDHPRVVEHYRAAHEIALRQRRGQASTEDLRQAMIDYRALLDELLERGPVSGGRESVSEPGREPRREEIRARDRHTPPRSGE
jgi:hypothetical protein